MPLSRHDRRHLSQVAQEARVFFKDNASEVQKLLDERNPGLILCHWLNDEGQVAIFTTRDDEMIVECYRDWQNPLKAALFREAIEIGRDVPAQHDAIIHDIIERGGGNDA